MTRSTIVVRTTGRAVQVVAPPALSTHCHAVRYRNYVIRLVLLSMLVLIDRSGENSVTTTTTMYVSAAAAAAASSFLIATDQCRNDGRHRRWTSGCRIMSLSFPPNEPSEPYSLGHINNNNNNNNNNNDMKQYRSQRWIVLVDDEASIRQAVGQLLIESGYQVTLCQDGSEALRVSLNGQPSLGTDDNESTRSPSTSSSVVVSTTTTTTSRTTASTVTTTKLPRPAPRAVPDVIVSDVRMPIMDGLTLLEQIRSHPQLVPIPVILLTAKSMVQDRVAGYQAGADAYLPKPFDPDELITLIDHFIQRHETLNDANQNTIGELQRNVQDIKYLLMEQMGTGHSPSTSPLPPTRVVATNVFLAPDERQVLNLLAQGKMTKEIADSMYLSTRRIEQLLTILFRKTKVKNRTELVRWAIATGNVKI